MTGLIELWLLAIFVGVPALILIAVARMAMGIGKDAGLFRRRPRGPICQYCGVVYPHHTQACPRYRVYKMDIRSPYPQAWRDTPRDPD